MAEQLPPSEQQPVDASLDPVLPYRPLAERNFRLYWAGGLTSNIGTWLQNVAASVYMVSLTGSSLWVGYLNLATFAPLFFFGMWGGVLSDRFPRRRIVTVTHSTCVVISFALAAITFAGLTNRYVLLCAAFGLGASYSLAKPTLSAILPAIVPPEHLARATAVNIFQFNLGQVVGSAVATVLLLTGQPGWAFLLNGLTFLGPIIAVRFLQLPPRGAEGRSKKKGFRAIAEGLLFIRRHRGKLAMLLSIVLANASVEAVRTLAPGFAQDALGIDEAAGGYIITAFSVGSASGLLLFTRLSLKIDERRLMLGGFAVQAAGVALIAASPNVVLAALAALPVGIGFTWLIPGLNAGLLRDVPSEFRGRVSAAFAMAHLGLRPLSGLTAGVLAAVLTERGAFALFISVGVVGTFAVRRLHSSPGRSG